MISEEMLDALRADIASKMSEKRFFHTAEVEKMAARLGALYVPDKIMLLRAAALLHDITKEYKTDRQVLICAQKGLEVTKLDLCAPKTFHARTAAALIPELYPDLADGEIIDCVRWHTTGRVVMTLCEKLIYLADYIDMSRTFEDCVRLRDFFFDKEPEKMDMRARLEHLDDTIIMSYDMTMRGLLEDGTPISADTCEARNELVCQKMARQK